MHTPTESALKLARLLQLCSANLPVGGFSFSQGLEQAVELQWVQDRDSTHEWINTVLSESVAITDLAILLRQFKALEEQDITAFEQWNHMLLACRESSELLMADLAMGKAMIRLLMNLQQEPNPFISRIPDLPELSFVSTFAVAALYFGLDCHTALTGYCWTFIDSQVAAATKLVPLGQTDAQNLLFKLSLSLDSVVTKAMTIPDDEIGSSLPGLAMVSSWHETQYSRLFRS